MPNVFIETYGCAANQSDSEIMAGLLKRAGFDVVQDINLADVIIVNTCIVKSPTEQKVLYRIRSLKQKFPRKKIVIAGCMPEAEIEKIREIGTFSVIGPGNITAVPSVVKKTLEGKMVEELEGRDEKICMPKIRKNPVIDIVQIASGCCSDCAYCSVRLAKGQLMSFPQNKILKEIKIAHKSGCKEFWLTAQDCACYGFDLGTDVAQLLQKIISNVDGNYFLRLGMLNPLHLKNIYEGLIEVYKDRHMFKFLHIPVQSGSNRILKKMKRGYTVEDFVNVVEAFKDSIPEITIWTDVIVGFPGESEEDFLKTLKLIEDVEPDFVNVSRYTVRPETEAAGMKQIPSQKKKDRTRQTSKLVNEISLKKNKEWIGWSGDVLTDEYNKDKKNWVGRNFTYKPVIIRGITRLGQTKKVRIVDATHTHLVGEVV
jgi:MiaB-like tRNA modifying enzyme